MHVHINSLSFPFMPHFETICVTLVTDLGEGSKFELSASLVELHFWPIKVLLEWYRFCIFLIFEGVEMFFWYNLDVDRSHSTVCCERRVVHDSFHRFWGIYKGRSRQLEAKLPKLFHFSKQSGIFVNQHNVTQSFSYCVTQNAKFYNKQWAGKNGSCAGVQKTFFHIFFVNSHVIERKFS